ncbi:sodium-dependent glucose transporter 1-like protein [Leptotrombidium deliense]|uniref:Major facilitator superfamily domain-containing protein 4A n=1 Tax=Leptotrombidium deliense TaxID=299467 RepID=A0A443S810_9ACAR|nr:sodium-dependent glucose transporter 1-like protein [Leptotrombidium deliense]
MTLTPVFPGFVYFLVNQAVFGFSAGGFDVASNVLVLELWNEKSQPFLQAIHLCFVVGGTIASLISSPFVESDNTTSHHLNNSIATTDTPPQKSDIYIPYLITGCVAVISAIIVFVYELMSPHVVPNRTIRRKTERLINESNDTQQESENNNSIVVDCALLPSSYYYTMITLSAFLLCFYKMFEFNILTYITLLVDSFELETMETSGSRIVATFVTVLCVFRFIAIFLSIKLSPAIMLYASVIILFMSNLVMFVSGWTTVSIVWVTAGFFGAGCAWIYGALYTFVEERIDVTNAVAGSYMCLASLATAIEPLIIGRFIEKNPLLFVYVNFVDVAIVAILFGFLLFTDFWKKSLLKRNLQP